MNEFRGEVSIELDGKTYALRPTFTALCEIESELNTSIPMLAQKFATGDVRIFEVAVIVHAGIHGANPNAGMSLEEVGDLVQREGMTEVMTQDGDDGNPALGNFLINGVSGGKAVPDAPPPKKTEESPQTSQSD